MGGPASVGIGLAAGALACFVLARLVEHMGTVKDSGGGTALTLGAFHDEPRLSLAPGLSTLTA